MTLLPYKFGISFAPFKEKISYNPFKVLRVSFLLSFRLIRFQIHENPVKLDRSTIDGKDKKSRSVLVRFFDAVSSMRPINQYVRRNFNFRVKRGPTSPFVASFYLKQVYTQILYSFLFRFPRSCSLSLI